MSRIGNASISVPSSVTVNIEGRQLKANGPLGELSMEVSPHVKVEVVDQVLTVSRKKDDPTSRAMHGLMRSLVANIITGVEKGWQKKLELVGVGFRAQSNGEKLTLTVGYSHPVEIDAPNGIKLTVEDNTKILVSGIDKNLVGQVAATIRKVRPPEPYQGKGIRYSGEYVRRKAGKAGKAGSK